MSPRALVADDERPMRLLLSKHLERRGWDVDAVEDGTAAFDHLVEGSYDAVILDQRMPGMTGVEVLQAITPAAPSFVFSAYLDPTLESEVRDLGATSINKLDLDELLAHVDRIAGA